MSGQIVLRSKSKVNLYFEIKQQQENGLHELESLFYPLEHPCDYLYIYPQQNDKGLRVVCPVTALEKDSILHRTYNTFFHHTGLNPGISLYLEKNVPMGAGLGGGSSNAAVFLKFLWNFFESHIDKTSLNIRDLALSLGSDVPFFLYDSPAWVSGVGERVESCAIDLSGYFLLVVIPDIFVSTADAYKAWDDSFLERKCFSETQSLLTRKGNSNIKKKFATDIWMFNSFEQVVFPKYPELRLIKSELLQCGASGVALSGSGAAISALFRNGAEVEKASSWLTERGIKAYLNSL